MPTIAVDAMGSAEHAEAAVRGVAEVSVRTAIECVLVGDERRIQSLLEQLPYNPEQIAIRHCSGEDDRPERSLAAPWRRGSSLWQALRAVVERRADAVVSGAPASVCLRAASQQFTTIPGVHQPALATVFPRRHAPNQDPLALLLDAGASARCQVRDLVLFAAMGHAYARCVSKVASPRVGLLNMGRDAAVGDDMLVEAYRRLADVSGLDFVGNVVGADLIGDKADVVVCEGFVGAVAASLLDGLAAKLGEAGRVPSDSTLLGRMGLRRLGQGAPDPEAWFDERGYGGAPILGYQQLLVVCRRWDVRTVANAVKVAAKAVRDQVPAALADAVSATAR